MIYSPQAFELLAANVLDCRMDDRLFRSNYGCSPDVCSILWETLTENNCFRHFPGAMPKHLLWTLLFLKTYDKEAVLASRLNTTRKTLRKWIWSILHAVVKLKRQVVSFVRIILSNDGFLSLSAFWNRFDGKSGSNMVAQIIAGVW